MIAGGGILSTSNGHWPYNFQIYQSIIEIVAMNPLLFDPWKYLAHAPPIYRPVQTSWVGAAGSNLSAERRLRQLPASRHDQQPGDSCPITLILRQLLPEIHLRRVSNEYVYEHRCFYRAIAPTNNQQPGRLRLLFSIAGDVDVQDARTFLTHLPPAGKYELTMPQTSTSRLHECISKR